MRKTFSICKLHHRKFENLPVSSSSLRIFRGDPPVDVVEGKWRTTKKAFWRRAMTTTASIPVFSSKDPPLRTSLPSERPSKGTRTTTSPLPSFHTEYERFTRSAHPQPNAFIQRLCFVPLVHHLSVAKVPTGFLQRLYTAPPVHLIYSLTDLYSFYIMFHPFSSTIAQRIYITLIQKCFSKGDPLVYLFK